MDNDFEIVRELLQWEFGPYGRASYADDAYEAADGINVQKVARQALQPPNPESETDG